MLTRNDRPKRRELPRKKRVARALNRQGRKLAAPETDPAPENTYQFVNLRVHEVRCVKTTKELGKDKIVLAAVKAESGVGGGGSRRKLVSKVEKGEQVDVGKFGKGDKESYPKTRVLARFASGGRSHDWPRHYVAVLLLIEEDRGAIGEVVRLAVERVDKQLTAAISAATASAATAALSGVAAGAAAGSVVPLVGSALGAAAGAAASLALAEIKKARADDVFDPKRAKLCLDGFPDQPGEIEGSKKTVSFKGFKGEYKVTYSWAVR